MSEINYEIHTERLFLRPKKMEDAEKVFEILYKNPDMTKMLSFDPPEKVEETKEFFKQREKEFPHKSVVWSIFFEEKLVGVISLEDIQRQFNAWRMDAAEMGYWLDPAFHNLGIMTEAVRGVLEFGFTKMNLHKITIQHLSVNDASRRVIEKSGFRLLGEQRDHCFRFGKWWNEKLYEMTIDEWGKLAR